VEGVVMSLFGNAYHARRILLTGHTGFKGSWLALWLRTLGAEVTGMALPPESTPNHWEVLAPDILDHRVDIRDRDAVERVVMWACPELVFHLAAQPLVRRSYREPLETWSTNVQGTANILEACRKTDSVRAVVVVTTDKCYENREWVWGYRENDVLGGFDPYSASKAAVELLVASYRQSFFKESGVLLATARAGNVIGGGDWSEDRLIPDLVRSVMAGSRSEIRSPNATRPWQHVLESLSGYLMLGERLLAGDRAFAEAWNFGPDRAGNRTVSDVLGSLCSHWPALDWNEASVGHPHETTLLYLDCSKAHQKLGWRPVWDFDKGLAATAIWYRDFIESGAVISQTQLANYVADAQAAGISWSKA